MYMGVIPNEITYLKDKTGAPHVYGGDPSIRYQWYWRS